MTKSRYELLIEEASSLRGAELLTDEREMTVDEAAAFLEDNRECLERASRALGPECAVPLRYDLEFFEGHLADLSALRDLARGFEVALSCALDKGDHMRAVELFVDMMDLASAARRGGLVVDALVGIAIEGLAIDRMRRCRFRLDVEAARQLAIELIRIDMEREPFAAVLTRDRHWDSSVDDHAAPMEFTDIMAVLNSEDGLDEESAEAIASAIQSFADQPEDEQKEFQSQLDMRAVALIRLLAIEAGLIAHYAQHGHYPERLTCVASEILTTLPEDPFTGREFKFGRRTDGYALYSPGPTGKDRGGVFGHWFSVLAGNADLCLDLYDFDMGCCE